MKFITGLILFIPFLCFSQAKTAEEHRAKDLKKYTIESVEIMYEIGGDATGNEMLVFTNFGWTSLKKRSMTFELYEITKTQTINEITDGDFVYRLNPEDSTYRTRKDLKWSQQASYQSPGQVSESILFSMGGKQQADVQLLGKNCQVWTLKEKIFRNYGFGKVSR